MGDSTQAYDREAAARFDILRNASNSRSPSLALAMETDAATPPVATGP